MRGDELRERGLPILIEKGKKARFLDVCHPCSRKKKRRKMTTKYSLFNLISQQNNTNEAFLRSFKSKTNKTYLIEE